MHTINVEGTSVAPGKIVCVGKNYLAHVREMGESKPPEEPTIFMKPNSAIAPISDTVSIPADFGLLHHEVELCFVVSGKCKNISKEDASARISAWGVGIDFTLRDRQRASKSVGGPWTISKCFDCAAVLGQFVQPSELFDPLNAHMELAINGEVRQSADTKQMIYSPVDVLSFVSRFLTIDPGDVFMCGTPKGVREVNDGDFLTAEIAGLPQLEFAVSRR
jgi:2-keto-4-pentenoate hydratase/2-oxohepta-3-ene-1,7-dioic acid hydratase in catechol pathway